MRNDAMFIKKMSFETDRNRFDSGAGNSTAGSERFCLRFKSQFKTGNYAISEKRRWMSKGYSIGIFTSIGESAFSLKIISRHCYRRFRLIRAVRFDRLRVLRKSDSGN